MKSMTDTVRYVTRQYPEAKKNNVALVVRSWQVQQAEGNKHLFDPASLIRVRRRLEGRKHNDQSGN